MNGHQVREWHGRRPRLRDLFGTETRRFVRERESFGATGVVIGARYADTNAWTSWFFAYSDESSSWSAVHVEIDGEPAHQFVGAGRPVFVALEPDIHAIQIRPAVCDDARVLANARLRLEPGEVVAVSIHPQRSLPLSPHMTQSKVRIRPTAARA